MPRQFFEEPILNSPYSPPDRHWELDDDGQPTGGILDARRPASFITLVPKPKKQKTAKHSQLTLGFDVVAGFSDQGQQYDTNALINAIRAQLSVWRRIPNPEGWGVTPETQRLLQHWRHHGFASIRPFFCQVEAEGQMLQRVMPELMGLRNILVINDEAHHCYRERPCANDGSSPSVESTVSSGSNINNDPSNLKGEEKEEAERNNETARLWISGIEAARSRLDVRTIYDLSATPFFLRGSGYAEGTLFPWTARDFSLMLGNPFDFTADGGGQCGCGHLYRAVHNPVEMIG